MILRNIFSDLKILTAHPEFRHRPLVMIFRMIRWAYHISLKKPARTRFDRWGFDLYLPAKRRGGSTAPFLFRSHYEPELIFLDAIVDPGMVVVDGGANAGIFAFAAARLTGPTGEVWAFEPGEEYYQAMLKSNDLNHFPQIKFRKEALVEKSGIVRFYHHLNRENAYGIGVEDEAYEVAYDEMAGVALDDVLERVDIIKLDIVGAEELALRGSRKLLSVSKPVVLFEIDPPSTDRLGLDLLGAATLLDSYGYHFYLLDDNHWLHRLEDCTGIRHIVALHEQYDLRRVMVAEGVRDLDAARRLRFALY